MYLSDMGRCPGRGLQRPQGTLPVLIAPLTSVRNEEIAEVAASAENRDQTAGHTFLKAVFGKKQEGHSSGGSAP
jgi:hypothetical protein